MSETQNWNEDEEDFPIPVKEAGKTESRLSALLFNLLGRHSPMSFTKIRSLLPDHYQNLENPDSDRKKLSRDLEELGELGFFVRSTQEGYVLDRNVANRELRLEKEELRVLAETILRSYQEAPSLELYSLSQKLFEGKLDVYPELEMDLKTQKSLSQAEGSASEELLKKLLEALKTKSPVQFLYYKTFPEETYRVEVDPIRLIRKNSEDYYLLAYDRKKKKEEDLSFRKSREWKRLRKIHSINLKDKKERIRRTGFCIRRFFRFTIRWKWNWFAIPNSLTKFEIQYRKFLMKNFPGIRFDLRSQTGKDFFHC